MDEILASDPTGILSFVQLERIPMALLVIAIAWLVTRTVSRVLDGLGDRFTGWRIVLKQTSAITRFLIFIGATALVVRNLIHLTNEVVLALGGSVAVAVGFAFKDLLASLMAGLMILFDRPFQVGDRVEVGGTYGEVVEIGLRTTRIVTLDDNLVSIPNNRFLNDTVASANAGALDQMCVFNFYVGPNQDFEAARRIAYEATVASRFAYLRKPVAVHMAEKPVPGMDSVIAIEVKVKAYVMDGRFETAFGTDVHERVKRAFRASGILTVGDLLAAHAPSGAVDHPPPTLSPRA